jgi:kynurenine formamidase
MNKVIEDRFNVVDLSHDISEKTVTWRGETGFSREIQVDYDSEGYRSLIYTFGACVGTHMDAPAHFDKGGTSLADIPLNNLIIPCCCIDVSSKSSDNFLISSKDIDNFEKKYGEIPPKSIVFGYTGWDDRWDDHKAYRNEDSDKKMHFPGFSLESAKLLLKRDVVGIGIDTLSPDGSENNGFDVHNLLLKSGKYFIENLTNLKKVPPKGSYVIALPLKIVEGTEIAVRVIALIPDGLKS